MSDNSNYSGGGLNFSGALQIAFIVLKLCHVINWSWWWVLAPTWIGFGIILAVVLGALLVIVGCRTYRRITQGRWKING